MKMEEEQQLKSVKLKLEQPSIMCSGREKVECYYRAKIIAISRDGGSRKTIEFKSYGEKIQVIFVNDICITEGWEDLKIIWKEKK